MEAVELTGADSVKYRGRITGTEHSDSSVALVVIHEWWGVGEVIEQRACELSAALQAPALVPDLYRGKEATDIDEASHLMQGLDFVAAASDIGVASEYLRDILPSVKKVVVVGFCMGGALSLLAAAKVGNVQGAVCFYGVPSGYKEVLKTVKLPVLMHFGELDQSKGFSDVDTAKEAAQVMEQAGAPVTLHIYKGHAHAFMNKPGPTLVEKTRTMMPQQFVAYDDTVYNLAMERTVNFVKSLA